MVIVGITGGIGSGKSYLCKIFESLYIPIFYTDDVSKQVLSEEESIKRYLIDKFGEDSFIDGKPNSAHLAPILFNDDKEMALLVEKVYPVMIERLEQFKKEYALRDIILVESAILFQNDFAKDHIDFVICVSSELETRINRVLERDSHRTYDDIQTIIRKQIPQYVVEKASDIVIYNNGEALLKQAEKAKEYFYKINREQKYRNRKC